MSALALVAIGCAAEEIAEEPAPAEAPMEEPAADPILADPTRPANEVAEDGDRMALEAYAFLGVEPGMTVADVWTGGGYNTHLLSRSVGDGQVVAILGFYADDEAEALAQRVVDAELSNVEIVSAIADVAADSIDVAVAVRNFHDADEYGDGKIGSYNRKGMGKTLQPGN